MLKESGTRIRIRIRIRIRQLTNGTRFGRKAAIVVIGMALGLRITRAIAI